MAKKKKRTTKVRRKTGAKKNAVRTERKADARLVERTLGLLIEHERANAASMRAIGEHLLDEYFRGDMRLAQSKNPFKPKSYALLAERAQDETQWDAQDFRRAVSMAIVYRSVPSSLRDALPVSYLYRLASIDDAVVRLGVAKRIANGELRGPDADAAIATANEKERAGGRPRTPAALRVVTRLVREAERAREEGALSAAQLKKIAPATRSRMAEQVLELAHLLAGWARAIDPK